MNNKLNKIMIASTILLATTLNTKTTNVYATNLDIDLLPTTKAEEFVEDTNNNNNILIPLENNTANTSANINNSKIIDNIDIGKDILEVSTTNTATKEDTTIVSSYMEERNIQIEKLKSEFPNLGVIDSTNETHYIYAEKDENSVHVGKTNGKTFCTINEFGLDWCKITSNEVSGYIQTKYIKTGDEIYVSTFLGELEAKPSKITIISNNVRLRENMDTTSNIIKTLKRGEEYNILEEQEDWYKIDLGDNQFGYISRKYTVLENGSVEIPYGTNEAMNYRYAERIYNIRTSWTGKAKYKTFSQEEVVALRKELVEYAIQFEGNPYVWGGTSLTKGADCSGFVFTLYKTFGFDLPRTAIPQSKIGIPIKEENLEPGDLIFFPRDEYPVGHVGMYIGDGKMINALNSKKGIVISRYDYRPTAGFVRIIG